MEKLLELLSKLVNPWTVFLLVCLVIFRSTLKKILSSLRKIPPNVSEIQYGNLRISLEKKRRLLQNIEEVSSEPEEKAPDDNKTRSVSQLISDMQPDLSAKDLILFVEVFSESEGVVVERGSKSEGSLYRLRDSGAVEMREMLVSMQSNAQLQEWVISDVGKALRDVLMNVR